MTSAGPTAMPQAQSSQPGAGFLPALANSRESWCLGCLILFLRAIMALQDGGSIEPGDELLSRLLKTRDVMTVKQSPHS